jgi:hypothetical protein
MSSYTEIDEIDEFYAELDLSTGRLAVFTTDTDECVRSEVVPQVEDPEDLEEVRWAVLQMLGEFDFEAADDGWQAIDDVMGTGNVGLRIPVRPTNQSANLDQ